MDSVLVSTIDLISAQHLIEPDLIGGPQTRLAIEKLCAMAAIISSLNFGMLVIAMAELLGLLVDPVAKLTRAVGAW